MPMETPLLLLFLEALLLPEDTCTEGLGNPVLHWSTKSQETGGGKKIGILDASTFYNTHWCSKRSISLMPELSCSFRMLELEEGASLTLFICLVIFLNW